MKKLFLITLILSVALISCNHKRHYKQKVQCYKTHSVDNTGNDMLLYYYLFWGQNNQSCYFYSSPTPIVSYSTISWQTSTVSPIASMGKEQVEELPEQEVSSQGMNQEMQQEMESNPENFEGMTQDEMGDFEGGNTDSGASDSGSGDSGGGDGGGGGD